LYCLEESDVRITTKDGTIVNSRFLREIQLDDRHSSATAIGENGCRYDLDYDYQIWETVFDPVIPGSGILLVAYERPTCESEPTIEDLFFAEYTIIGWRIPGYGNPVPLTAMSGSAWNVGLRAIKEVDGWALLGDDGLSIGRLRDRTEFEHHALASARCGWHIGVEMDNRRTGSQVKVSKFPHPK
jgi:hypothetical protein